MKILEEFNIGDYRVYQIPVVSKKKPSDEYVYLHYYSFANAYIDYGHSKFYKETGGSFNFDSRELISIGTYEEIDAKRSAHNKGLEYADPQWCSISPKELFLKDNPLDLFKFNRLSTIGCFMSARLAKRLSEEKITGFKLSRTTKVKDL